MDRDLDGRKAIVTGSGKGFGRAIALRLAGGGADVLCADVDLASAEATAALVRGLGRRALACKADVSRTADVEGMVAAAAEAFGRIDILVNNAGVWENVPIEEISEESWDRVLGVNLRGVFLCCRAAVPRMKAQRYGRIVNIGSVAGRMGGTNAGADYVASKGGVIAFTKKLAMELGPFGITVNAVNPGPTRTDLTADWPEEYWRDVIKRIPLGRFGDTDDIAEGVAFLASDRAKFITGETLEVNGGLLVD